MQERPFIKRNKTVLFTHGLIMTVFLLTSSLISGCDPAFQNNAGRSDAYVSEGGPSEGKDASEGRRVDAKPVSGGALTIYTLEETLWDPLLMRRSQVLLNAYEGLVYRGLFRYDALGDWTSDLAQDETIEQGDDGTVELSLNLPTDVRWPDGSSVTFDDVRETFQYYLHPFYYGAWKDHLLSIAGTSAYRSGESNTLSGITVDEEGRVHIKLEQPTALAFRALTAPLLKADEILGRDPDEVEKLADEGVLSGLGPYRLANKPSREGLHFIRRDPGQSGVRDGAYIESITVVPVQPETILTGDAARVTAAMIDQLSRSPSPASLVLPPGVSADTLDALHKNDQHDRTKNTRTSDDYRLVRQPLPYSYYLAFNMRTVDRPSRALITEKFYASGDETSAPMSAPLGEMRPDFLGRVSDQALDEAYKAGLSSLMRSAPSSFSDKALALYFDEDDPQSTFLAERLARVLGDDQKVLDLHGLKHDDFYATIFSGQSYDMFIWPIAHGQTLGEWWRYLGITHDVDRLGLNVMHYDRPEVDQALQDAYRVSPERIDREGLKDAFQRIGEDGVLVPLFRPDALRVQSKRIQGPFESEDDVLARDNMAWEDRRQLWFWWLSP
ncbi:MAG: hypothetical protein IMX04_03500 [Candidatus Carbobacillus altaicus]|nr:hypothetical protein [Candidatus Carbobacillus altaicus]